MYRLYVITTALNAACAVLYFMQNKPILGGIWTLAAILWGSTTVLNYKEKRW